MYVDREVIEKKVVVKEVLDPVEQVKKNRIVVEKPVYVDKIVEKRVERFVDKVVDVPEIVEVKKNIRVPK